MSASVHISHISVRRTAHTLVGPPHDHAVIAMQKGSLNTSAMKTATVALVGGRGVGVEVTGGEGVVRARARLWWPVGAPRWCSP